MIRDGDVLTLCGDVLTKMGTFGLGGVLTLGRVDLLPLQLSQLTNISTHIIGDYHS